MKVWQLIERLQAFDRNALVRVWDAELVQWDDIGHVDCGSWPKVSVRLFSENMVKDMPECVEWDKSKPNQ